MQALQNMVQMAIPAAIYAVVVRWRADIPLAEIGRRLGLGVGTRRAYVVATAVTLPLLPLTFWVAQKTSGFQGSMIAPFLDQPVTLRMIAAAVTYGFVATGFPEELLFRGLIAGALFRRFKFWTANLIQTAIFTAIHLPILLVAPELWPLATVLPTALGLTLGWLRHTADSIWPGVILHAVPNVFGALSVLNWGG